MTNKCRYGNHKIDARTLEAGGEVCFDCTTRDRTKRFKLNCGIVVTSRDGEWPTQYANRTQAERAAAKIENAVVVHIGRPFYVAIPERI